MSSMETYSGHVRTPQDAITLFEACRLGLLPRVQRRLSEKERQQIKSGSVFVWDEREAGMRRWTDGKSWSASRVSGSFLTYREMEGKRGGFPTIESFSNKKLPGINNKTLEGSKMSSSSDSDLGDGEEGPDGYRYKPDGLMKQSFSITTQDNRHLHLISYYSRAVNAPALQQPSTDPALRNIRPQKGMYPETNLNEGGNNIPAVTRGPLGPPVPNQWPSSAPEIPSYPYQNPHHPPYMSGYPPPPAYPQANWPPSPVSAPVHYPYYPPPPSGPHGHPYSYPPPPPPGHAASPYPPPPPPQHHHYPSPSLHSPQPPYYERHHHSSGATSSTLPPIINGNSSSSSHAPHVPHVPHVQHVRSPRIPPPGYGSSQPAGPMGALSASASALRPNPYTSSSMVSKRSNSTSAESGPRQRPASLGHSPPALSNGHANSPPLRDLAISQGNGASTPTKTTIPSIGSLLSRDDAAGGGNGREGAGRDGRGRSRSPPGIARGSRVAREVADPIKASGFERDRSDLKRLDAQALKF